jgi:hypothetical protein
LKVPLNTITLTPSCSWSYGSWIYNYLWNQLLLSLTLWVWIPLRRGVLDTFCDKVFFSVLSAGRWLSPVILVSSTNKTDHHDITKILFVLIFMFWTIHSSLTMLIAYMPLNLKWTIPQICLSESIYKLTVIIGWQQNFTTK